MSISNFRSTEALYIIIVREKDAEKMLKEWSNSVNARVQIEKNRMKLFDQQTLTLFQMNWKHNWNNVNIWDVWNRRHLNG